MDTESLKVKYDLLLKDLDFDRLELGLNKPNIFQVLHIAKNEIRHSNFLSWVLDPKASHKMGDVFLKRFLREVLRSDKFTTIDQVDIEGLNLNSAEILREWEHIDLLIKTDSLIVCVENKILSKEHSNQLERYRSVVEQSFPAHKKTYVYLSPDGHQPMSEADYFETISYEYIVETLEKILTVYSGSLSEQVITYISDYVTIVKREIMKTDELTELSRKLYQNHKELLDFIYEHKPDPIDKLRACVTDRVKKRGWIMGSENKTYARFLTPKISHLIYYNKDIKNGWKNGESFLFEIVVYPPSNSLILKTVISPSDEAYDSRELEKILLGVKGAKSSRGAKWLVNHTKKMPFNYDEIHSYDDDTLASLVDKFLNKVSPLVSAIEDQLLLNEANLLELKNIG